MGETPFATLDRVDGRTRGRVDVTVVEATNAVGQDPATDSYTLVRLEAHVQWVHRMGFGLYGAAGVVEGFRGGHRDRRVPSPEVGALYARRLHDAFDIITHAGIAYSRNNSFEPLLRESAAARITDYARSVTDHSWYRFTVSPVIRVRPAVIRVDLGVDSRSSDPGDPMAAPEKKGPLLRFGIGAGLRSRCHQLGIEYAAFADAGRPRGYRRQYQTAAASYRFGVGFAELFAAVTIPLSGPRERTDDAVGPSLMVGVDLLKR